MDTKMSALKGVDRTWHLNWLQMRETGQRLPLGYGNKFSKCLYSSMVPHTCWEQGGSIRGVHHGGVFNLEFSPDGSLLVAACEKRSFLMFDALSQKQVHAVENAHRDCVNCVRFLDSRTFVTCSDDSTVALWDARNLKSSIRTLHGHSNWVKNIEYSQNDGLLVTSGFDGSIYTWDINSYTENGFNYERVFHTNGLMRTRLTPDATKMIICTTGGYLMIIHDLNLHTLAQDLNGFKPNMYRLMQQSQTTIPAASVFTSLFSKKRKRNRIEFVTDFPTHNDPEVVSSLQIHPQGWCALSRNISHEELSEWTCVHDIQDRDDYDSMTDNEELPGYMRDDSDDVVFDEFDTSNNPRGFRGFPNPNYNSESDSDADSDSDWPPGRRPPVSRGSSRPNLRNIPPPEVDGTDSSSSTDSESVNPRRARAAQNASPRAPVGSRRPANRTGGQGDEVNSNPVHRRGGNIRRLRITVDGQVQMSDDDSSGEPASNVRVVDAQESNRPSGTSRLSGSRPRPRFSLRSSPSTSHSARTYHGDSSRYNALRRLSSLEGSSAAHPSSSSSRDTPTSLADSGSSLSARSSEQTERPLQIPPSRASQRSNNSPQSTSQSYVANSSISSSSSSDVQSTSRRTDQSAPQEVSAIVAPSSSQSRIQTAPPGSPPSDLHDPAQAEPRPGASSSNADADEDANASANEDINEDALEDANAGANPGANAGPNAGPNETANAAAAVGAARQARGGQGNIPLSQNMELHVASADVWEALVVIREARARRQQVPSRNLNSGRDRRDLISRFLRRLHDLNEPRQQSQAITPGSSTSSSSSSATNNSNPATTTNSTAPGNSPSEAGASSARPDRPRLLRIARARQSTRQGQAPAAIALGHFLRNPTPATRTLVMIAPHQGGAQNIHLRVSPNSYSYQSQQLKIPRNHKIHQNMPRLSHYIEEPNVGKGFIKELCFSSDGRVMCSPFSYGIRLLSFTPDCQEISTSLPTDPPVRLYEVSERMCHEDYVVSSKFSPTHCLLVSGCLKGKIVWHQPNL
ncbi:DDB1- and CUL4-associated factor 10 homolog isoform X2 [Thrips palmi]|uniref:DDB1- and CUL4-associated factor 10 homolog isoform X2 n=1 Tax=Thrips palmi TaxID=161013 RepID=A0A6P8Y7P9_THRPL|nr:DDB1- and CUL4-associated factor 10 homolog isoform X2 [Thrips palmi]